jgi:hypothetical protein
MLPIGMIFEALKEDGTVVVRWKGYSFLGVQF